ncbi:MAG: thiamine phosphate synthase [Nannocystaceae bacterium]|nr:thiamine phosphate synthase [Nannocystaceae bacterium]
MDRTGLYAIVDSPHAGGLSVEAVCRALLAGGPLAAVQLRAKHESTAQRRALALALAPACRAAGVPLVVNDDAELALAEPAIDGVHLGQGDPGFDRVAELRARAGTRRLLVGISTHDLPQLRAALLQAPDYVAFGPVFPTPSKANPDPTVGVAGLADACRVSSRPVVAIGGLTVERAAVAIGVGASMVAVIGGLVAPSEGEISSRAAAYVAAVQTAAQSWTLARVHAAIPVLSPAALTELARWADDLAVLAGMRLPARFRPSIVAGEVFYRPSDVCDLLWALGKRADESWAQWSARPDADGDATLVRLRTLG